MPLRTSSSLSWDRLRDRWYRRTPSRYTRKTSSIWVPNRRITAMTISAARPDPASPIHTYVMGSARTFMVTSIREYPITVSALFVYTASKTMGSVRPVGVPSRIRRSRVMMRDCVGWTSVESAWNVRFTRDPSRADGFAFSSRENDFEPGATFVQLQVYVELTVVRVASDVSVMYKKLAGSGRESWTPPATPLPALTR